MSYINLHWVNPPDVQGQTETPSSIRLETYAVVIPSVFSVNGNTGAVVLAAVDVGADESGSADAVRADLTAGLNLKLDVVDYVQHFLGVFASYSALTTAHPTALDGDYAQIDSGIGFERLTAIWDSDDTTWRIQQAGAASNTDEVPEGSSNLYFTGGRVRSTPLTGLGAGANTPILATDQLLTALAKLQAQIASAPGAVQWVDVLPPFLAQQPLLFTDPNGNNALQVAKIDGMIYIRGALTKDATTGIISGYTHDLCFLPNTHKVYIPGNYARGPAVFYSSNDGSLGFIKSWGVQPSYSIFDPTNQKITILETAYSITQSSYNVCTFIGVLGLALTP